MMRRITLQEDVRRLMKAWQHELQPSVLHGHIARAEERLFKDHIGKLPPNKLGKSTGFWADSVRSTVATATDNGCVISINKLGFRQRYYGGEIKPVNGKYLAIPARSEFYGARPREFTNLRFLLFKSGTAALVINEGGAEKITGLNSSRSAGGQKSAGTVAFWLVKSVNQTGNPNIIPSDAAITQTALDAIGGALARAKARAK